MSCLFIHKSMTVEICSCTGLDPDCKKCFGSGYLNAATSKKPMPKTTEKPVKKQQPKLQTFLPAKIDVLSKAEVEKIAVDIIVALDLRSRKQMQLLNSIPFNTNTFRRDFKDKFESLQILENEKEQLRNELFVVDQEIIAKNYKSKFRFKHFLSDKNIDVDSNRQLKELIREYKKLKSKAGS